MSKIGYKCRKCNGTVSLPSELGDETKQKACESFQKFSRLRVMETLKYFGKIDLGDAKFVAMHFANPDKTCHRCKTNLESSDASICPKCKSLNFNWW